MVAPSLGYHSRMRWTLSLAIAALPAIAGCSKTNPGWLESEGGGGSQGTGSTTTGDPTSTATTTGDPTTTDASSSTTTGEEPVICPTKDYCPFFIDVASDPDMGSCNGLDAFVAFKPAASTTFFRCASLDTCSVDQCTELELDLPPEYAIIVNQIPECSQIEHEKAWIGGTCRTRSLAVWDSDEDPKSAGPRIMLAAHTAEAPPAVASDLTVTATDVRAKCECNTQSCNDFIVPEKDWCCGGQVSLGGYSITNDLGDVFRAVYVSYILDYVSIPFRGCKYEFRVTQAHDGFPDCSDQLSFQAGWFMQRSSCQ